MARDGPFPRAQRRRAPRAPRVGAASVVAADAGVISGHELMFAEPAGRGERRRDEPATSSSLAPGRVRGGCSYTPGVPVLECTDGSCLL
jgi:hypothetical protein